MFQLDDPQIKENLRVAVVAARFNRFIVDQLVTGALDALDRHGVDPDRRALVWVPGAYELPVVADRFASSGRYDAVVALGAVIRGGTPHFDFVAGECASGLNRVALEYGVPVAFGVLTTETVEQAIERAAPDQGNKGFDVTMAALETASSLYEIDRHVAELPAR